MTLTEEWIAKAEGDYEMAAALNRLRKKPQYDGVCYHCQQSAEKYLKAFLVDRGDTPRRIHDLVELLKDCAVHEPSIMSLEPDVRILDPYSVEFRYPGDFATREESRQALSILRRLRKAMRRTLRL